MEEITELQTRIQSNEFNETFNKHFHVNELNEVVIKGVMSRIILSEKQQSKLVREIKSLEVRKIFGDDVTELEKIALSCLFDSTY